MKDRRLADFNMIDIILSWLNGIPAELAVTLIAMLPVGELRAAIPIGVASFGLSPWVSFFFAYLGNLVPVFFIFWLFPIVLRISAEHIKWLNPFLDKYCLSLERKYKDKYDKYGALAIVLLVAIPLPGSGVWTGSLISILFGVEKKYSVPAIFLGLAIAGGIVTLITQGTLSVLDFLI